MTRIAALSDVHGNVAALEAVIADITREKPDRVVIAGDLVLNGPEPVAVVDMLQNLAAEGTAIVTGNTDIAVADFDFAAAFPWMTDGVPDAIVAAAEWAPTLARPRRRSGICRAVRSASLCPGKRASMARDRWPPGWRAP